MHSIRNDHRVKMTEMRQAIRVVDWSGYVESVQRIIFHLSFIIFHIPLISEGICQCPFVR
jgi:hypothetical protein